MTEKEKMLSGELYRADDPELVKDRYRARMLFQQINQMKDDQMDERLRLFYELFGKAGEGLNIQPPFYCDYGSHIQLGINVFMNFNCCILDVAPVLIGDNVQLGPNVQIYAATHPLDVATRSSGLEYGKPVRIENDVWIGGGAIICPGVTIGQGSVVGAGSVVTRDVPPGVLMAGNPASVVREIRQ